MCRDEWQVRDLEDLVRRDKHHPSVVMWSIGNENELQDPRSLIGPAMRQAVLGLGEASPGSSRPTDQTRPAQLTQHAPLRTVLDRHDASADGQHEQAFIRRAQPIAGCAGRLALLRPRHSLEGVPRRPVLLPVVPRNPPRHAAAEL
jgi:hypothetical protein